MAATQSRVPIRARAGVFNIFEAVDYKTWFALAEFVDNSIQSWLDAVAAGILPTEPLEIVIETSSADGGYIVIRDTAAGIPEERFGSGQVEPGGIHRDGRTDPEGGPPPVDLEAVGHERAHEPRESQCREEG